MEGTRPEPSKQRKNEGQMHEKKDDKGEHTNGGDVSITRLHVSGMVYLGQIH